jgi:hypothetical protein
MKHLLELLSKIFAAMLVFFLFMILLTSDPCTRVHRSSIPVLYLFRSVDYLSQNWTSEEAKIWLLRAEIESALATERFFEKTFNDVAKDKTGEVIYVCNPESPKEKKGRLW